MEELNADKRSTRLDVERRTMIERRERRRETRSFGFYLLRIDEWDWSYNFGLVSERFAERHFEEFRHLRLRGAFLRPRNIEVEKAELIFLPNVPPSEMEAGERPLPELPDRPPPLGVGSLFVQEKRLIGHLEMPKDALDPVLHMLQAGRLRYVALHGEAMRYNKCIIRHYGIKERDDETTAMD